MTQTFQTNITVMQDADGIMEIFTVHTENGKKVLTMDEYIERGEAIEAVKHAWAKGLEPSQYIEIIPASDVAPLRHAKWVDNHCTACGMMPMGDEMWKLCDFEPPRFEKFMDYCPNCGCRMDG